jgi:UPF0755 protein
MPGYNVTKRTRRGGRVPRRIWLLLTIVAVIGVAGSFVVRHQYDVALNPVSNNQTTQLFTVESGSSSKTIASNLQKQHLIRSAWAMELYIHSKELGNKLQAGTYALAPSQTTQSIVTILTKGKVSTHSVTILPGKRIDQIRATLINDGFTPSAVDQALNPAQYTSLPVLSFKPASVTTLEGLLWPDTFQVDANNSVGTIITESLQEMSQHLDSTVQAGFARQGLNAYQGLTLASVITQEVSKPFDQAQAAQVFLSRLKMGTMLGSDVTANYGAVAAGKQPNLTYDSPYNTLIHTGLPPTPISNVTASALLAATHPAATTWLYFVSGDDGTTYFSNTLQEHQALTQKYCHKLCGQ